MQLLADQLADLPETPGAYVLLGQNGLHYYTGAARNLFDRLRDPKRAATNVPRANARGS